MGGLIHFVVAFRFEEEMADLAADHGGEPTDECGGDRVGENQNVGGEKTQCTDEMQRLIDAAVMVVAMVVPTLDPECFKKFLHCISFAGNRNVTTGAILLDECCGLFTRGLPDCDNARCHKNIMQGCAELSSKFLEPQS